MRRSAILVALAILAVLFAVLLGRYTTSLHASPDRSPAIAEEVHERAPTPAREEGSPARRPRTWAEGSRVPVPRPAAPPEARSGGAEDGEVADEAWPQYRPPPPGGEVREEDVREVISGQVIEPVRECIDDWMAVDPALEGRVVLGITLGPGGLEAVEIVDHSEVPPGPLSCFASAVWEAGWPAADEPVEITYPFVFTSGDEAPPDGPQ